MPLIEKLRKEKPLTHTQLEVLSLIKRGGSLAIRPGRTSGVISGLQKLITVRLPTILVLTSHDLIIGERREGMMLVYYRLTDAGQERTRYVFPDEANQDELYFPPMKARTEEEATLYFEGLVERAMRVDNLTRLKAEEIIRHNLGYYGGYCSFDTRLRIERLYNTVHPYLGDAATTGQLSTEEILKIGMDLGRELTRKEAEETPKHDTDLTEEDILV